MSAEANSNKSRRGRPIGRGGRRLAEAFETVSALPALAEARRRVLRACAEEASGADIAEVIESDTGLAIALMRAANNGGGPPGRTGGVTAAIEALQPTGVVATVSALGTYDLLEHPERRWLSYDRFRRHAVAVRHPAERIADLARLSSRDEIAVAALLHDVGRLVLAEMYGDEYEDGFEGLTPDERARRERRELGIDRSIVGAVLIRRWVLPGAIAAAVERHHAANARGVAAAVRVADLLVHRCAGDPVRRESLRDAAATLGIDEERLRMLSFEFSHLGPARRRPSQPCPLSTREVDALRGLADGKVYKQIAQELSPSVSTVRTHLHNVYRKIGAVDRAQAVLLARDRGWV